MVPRAPRAWLIPAAMALGVLSAPEARAQSRPEPCPLPFAIENPDTLGAVGFQSSTVTDSAGRAHIAYRNGSGSQIRYAHQDGQQWVVELVPQAGFSHGLSLALDRDGNPYVGYGAQEETPIGVVTSAKVAWKIGDHWTTERIENAFPTEAAIAFDPAGVLHAVYFSFIPAFVIRYATHTADGWSTETVFPTGGFGAGRFSLAFDSQGRPHVTAQVLSVPLHAVRTESGWAVDRQLPGEGLALALDAADVPHVATHLRDPAVVQYRTRGNGVWSVEAVDSVDAGPGRSVAVAIDRFGRPFLCYYDVAAGRLKVAWKDQGIWSTRIVDVGGVGEGPSIALAGGTQPRIAFMDPSTFDLRAASGEIPPPNRVPVANAGGPYAGAIGQRITFHATGSSDPDGDLLVYAWDFGDGVAAVGIGPEHAYAAAGTYRVCLSVTDQGCPKLTDRACLTATIQESLAARVFRNQKGRIELSGAGARECFLLEPVEADFRSSDLDPSTVRATFNASQASPVLEKSFLVTDSDGNGIEDIQICFAASTLGVLFDTAPAGRSLVTLGLTGALRSGARVRGDLEIEIHKHKDCRDGCTEVSPNPLNPDAVITFTIPRSEVVEIDLFDAQGRLLGRILPPTFLGAGTHERRITPRDPSGRPLPSGVYFYRVRTSEGDQNGRFSILK